MFVECTHPDHRVDVSGRVDCPAENCLAAAIDRVGIVGTVDPMSRLPATRPDWILSSPDTLEHAEVEALAVLGDAGLVPQIVAPGVDDAATPMRPAAGEDARTGAAMRRLRVVRGA